MIDWAEKYRPATLKEVVGNNAAVEELSSWADSWEAGKPAKKGVILVGPPGVGKTTCAHALANDFGWSALELNASDTRNYEAIKRVAGSGALHETFTAGGEFIQSRKGGRKLIILDEADNLFGTEDRGGLQAIVETVRNTRQPVVLIVNDYYALTRKSSAIKELCLRIKFLGIRKDRIKAVLRAICRLEKIEISLEALEELAERAEGDLRSAINDLQSVSEGRAKISAENLGAIGYRDPRETIFSALTKIFKTTSLAKARAAARDLDEPPDRTMLWIDENLPLEYKEYSDLKKGYDALSKADVFLGRIVKRQYYSLWAYANDLMTGGIALAKRAPYPTFTRYQFPSWLSKMASSKSSRAVRDSVLGKLAKLCHTSQAVVRETILYWFKYLFKKEREFACNLISELELSLEEIAYLLEEKPASPKVKSVLKAAEHRAELRKRVTIKKFE